jgi:hypothetical protein
MATADPLCEPPTVSNNHYRTSRGGARTAGNALVGGQADAIVAHTRRPPEVSAVREAVAALGDHRLHVCHRAQRTLQCEYETEEHVRNAMTSEGTHCIGCPPLHCVLAGAGACLDGRHAQRSFGLA